MGIGVQMNEEICAHCKFFELEGDHDDRGFCRRYPRVPMYPDDSLIPEVNAWDWCGEFKEKK